MGDLILECLQLTGLRNENRFELNGLQRSKINSNPFISVVPFQSIQLLFPFLHFSHFSLGRDEIEYDEVLVQLREDAHSILKFMFYKVLSSMITYHSLSSQPPFLLSSHLLQLFSIRLALLQLKPMSLSENSPEISIMN